MKTSEEILKEKIVENWTGDIDNYINPILIPKVINAMEEYAQMKVNELRKSDVSSSSFPILKTEYVPSFGTMPEHWMAYLENMKGMIVTADTEEQAINEMMMSIKVMLLHNDDK